MSICGVSVSAIFPRTRERPPPIIFARIDRQINAYNFVGDSFHESRLSLSEIRFYTENGRFAFFAPPPFEGLTGNGRCVS